MPGCWSVLRDGDAQSSCQKGQAEAENQRGSGRAWKVHGRLRVRTRTACQSGIGGASGNRFSV